MAGRIGCDRRRHSQALQLGNHTRLGEWEAVCQFDLGHIADRKDAPVRGLEAAIDLDAPLVGRNPGALEIETLDVGAPAGGHEQM